MSGKIRISYRVMTAARVIRGATHHLHIVRCEAWAPGWSQLPAGEALCGVVPGNDFIRTFGRLAEPQDATCLKCRRLYAQLPPEERPEVERDALVRFCQGDEEHTMLTGRAQGQPWGRAGQVTIRTLEKPSRTFVRLVGDIEVLPAEQEPAS